MHPVKTLLDLMMSLRIQSSFSALKMALFKSHLANSQGGSGSALPALILQLKMELLVKAWNDFMSLFLFPVSICLVWVLWGITEIPSKYWRKIFKLLCCCTGCVVGHWWCPEQWDTSVVGGRRVWDPLEEFLSPATISAPSCSPLNPVPHPNAISTPPGMAIPPVPCYSSGCQVSCCTQVFQLLPVWWNPA